MPNHIHLIWRIQNGFKLETVQRDFLKFTAKALVEKIKAEKGEAAGVAVCWIERSEVSGLET